MATFQKYQGTAPDISTMESIEPASVLEANLKAGVTNESHLHSLGFVMDNGRPRFKIDEPVGSPTGPNSLKSGPNTLRNCPDGEEDSFVVLGKDSLSYIQASSSASYSEIQQKSMMNDYSSIISSLSTEETEKKLKELLQENLKLKETLSQNNLAMKRQFNTLVTWQEEIMKVHQSHKQKFSETKELIHQLRKENAELKNKTSQELLGTNDNVLKVKELQQQLQQTVLAQSVVHSVKEVELQEVNSKLTKELEEFKTACKVLTSDIERYKALSTRLSQQLKQADLTIEGLKLDLERQELNFKEREQLASLADYSLLSVPSKQTQEVEMWKAKDRQQNDQIKHLRELITSLENQLKVTSLNCFPTIAIETSDASSHLPSEDRLQFVKNVQQYNEILQKLCDCYVKQGSGYVNVQECLKEAIDYLSDLEKMKSSESQVGSQQEKLDKLANCQVRLNEERLTMITERQELIKAQNQFQKVFSDYNSVLYELEIMHEENTKLSHLQTKNNEVVTQQESLQLSPEMKNNLSKEKKSAEDSEARILQEKSDLEQKKIRDVLESECENLKKALSRQKNIQEAEQKTFAEEKRNVKETMKDLKQKNQNLEQMLQSKTEELESLKSEVKSLKEETEKLPVLEAQLQVYVTDFQEERQARQNLAQDKDKLVQEMLNLQKMHQDLLANLNSQQKSGTQQQQQYQPSQVFASAPPPNRSESDDTSTPVITAFSCPKCSMSFTALRPLEEHVEECLELL